MPAANLIGDEGDGFAIAQARLGPGRIHHCMRLIGMAERALELMCRRAASAASPSASRSPTRAWSSTGSPSRGSRIEQARLLVLKTAWLMDTVGNQGAHTEIQAIKIAVPQMAEWVLDKAIQAHGAGGRQPGHAAGDALGGARTLRLADGPDEVHEVSLARRELKPYRPTLR